MEAHQPSSNLNYTTESAHLVKTLLERHRHTFTKEQEESSDNAITNWVASKDFTVEVGKKQIGEYIQTWEMQPSWLYSLDFLYTTEEDFFTCYHYRARFSNPTPQRPIQGTASVYFVVGISKVRPEALPVEVLFVLESNRLVHTPGRTRFKEKWLADLIESKYLLGRTVNF
ncbi:hypothetical protein Q5P01_003526 [Channa striata]|uniref:Uncharacterized protein n=1 Tax=Channa striata TaxID=64152 RepID=A0AA88NMM6_CHASR|nr:hypothetical protein Q5P01_003526 [Channa striata]